MYISKDDMNLLENGLKELLAPSKRETRTSNVATRKRSFDEVYASTRRDKPKTQLSYEEEQKIAEQKWLKQRERLYFTKGMYETKLVNKPYVSFYAQ